MGIRNSIYSNRYAFYCLIPSAIVLATLVPAVAWPDPDVRRIMFAAAILALTSLALLVAAGWMVDGARTRKLIYQVSAKVNKHIAVCETKMMINEVDEELRQLRESYR